MDLKHLKRQNTWVKQCEIYVDEITPPMDGEHSLMQSLDVTFSCGSKDSMTYYYSDPMFEIDIRAVGKQWYDIKWTGTELKCRPAEAKQLGSKLTSEFPDWDAIAEGKCRHGYIVAEIEKNGLESFVISCAQGTVWIDKDKLKIIKQLAKFSMTGETK